MARFLMRTAVLAVICATYSGTIGAAAEWKAGVGRAVITPKEPLWMAGYGAA